MRKKLDVAVVLGAKDNASNKLKKVRLAAVALGAAAVAGAYKAVQAAAIQEQAENALESALRSNGDAVSALLPKYKALAAEIQNQTTAADESTLAMMAQIRNLGVMPGQMEQATKGAIGLAKALNLDANSAARYTALALKGETTILQRYVPALRTATTAAEKQKIVTDLMNRGYEQAQAETDTFSGKLQQLKNSLGDIVENLGFLLLPLLTKMVTFIQNNVVPRIMQLTSSFRMLQSVVTGHVMKTKELIAMQGQMAVQNTEVLVPSIVAVGETTNIVVEGIRARWAGYYTERGEQMAAHLEATKAMHNAFVDMTVNNIDSLSGLWGSFKDYVINMVLKEIISQLYITMGVAKAVGSIIGKIGFGGILGGIGKIFGFADGGVINEPIVGRGMRSGNTYTFGERGTELVTPIGKAGGTGLSLTVNVSGNTIVGRNGINELTTMVSDKIIGRVKREVNL